jgi:GNAT superfamily N-acetyltransferase
MLEKWSGREVRAFLLSFEPEAFDSQGRAPGFSILNRRFIHREYHSDVYPDPYVCPPWQRQSFGECRSGEFDRALIARVGPCVVGILCCQWKQISIDDKQRFWAYQLAFVDVHESWRDRGLSSALIRELDKQEWLRGKILHLSSYTPEGFRRLRKVVSRELRAEEYIVLHQEYCTTELPTAAGRWISDSETF